jgi:hypothetical protein
VKKVLALRTAVEELEEEAKYPESLFNRSGPKKRDEAARLIKRCDDDLHKLEKFLDKYKSLDSGNARRRDRLGFASRSLQGDLSEVRVAISGHTGTLNFFLQQLNTGALGRLETGQGRIEMKLDKLAEEVRLGLKSPALLALAEDWASIEKELIDDTITEVDLEVNKGFIKDWLRKTNEDDGISKFGSDEEHDPADDQGVRNHNVTSGDLIDSIPLAKDDSMSGTTNKLNEHDEKQETTSIDDTIQNIDPLKSSSVIPIKPHDPPEQMQRMQNSIPDSSLGTGECSDSSPFVYYNTFPSGTTIMPRNLKDTNVEPKLSSPTVKIQPKSARNRQDDSFFKADHAVNSSGPNRSSEKLDDKTGSVEELKETDIMKILVEQGMVSPEATGSSPYTTKPSKPKDVVIVECKLPVTLEEIYHGVTKRFRVIHDPYDRSEGQVATQSHILEVPVIKGIKPGAKIKFNNPRVYLECGYEDIDTGQEFSFEYDPEKIVDAKQVDIHFILEEVSRNVPAVKFGCIR